MPEILTPAWAAPTLAPISRAVSSGEPARGGLAASSGLIAPRSQDDPRASSCLLGMLSNGNPAQGRK